MAAGPAFAGRQVAVKTATQKLLQTKNRTKANNVLLPTAHNLLFLPSFLKMCYYVQFVK
jgi:hypothetical protein